MLLNVWLIWPMDLYALYHLSPAIEALPVNAFSLEKNILRTASK